MLTDQGSTYEKFTTDYELYGNKLVIYDNWPMIYTRVND